jgi:hypothetical protein
LVREESCAPRVTQGPWALVAEGWRSGNAFVGPGQGRVDYSLRRQACPARDVFDQYHPADVCGPPFSARRMYAIALPRDLQMDRRCVAPERGVP